LQNKKIERSLKNFTLQRLCATFGHKLFKNVLQKMI
jgi:hypothetical protein